MTRPDSPHLSPLKRAADSLARARATLRFATALPVPMIVGAGAAMVLSNIYLFHNAFLTLFLAIIFAVFFVGQSLALRQLLRMRAGLTSAERTVQALAEAGGDPDLKALRERLEADVPQGDMRDLILGWIDLGLQGTREGHGTLLEDSLDRRAIHDGRLLGIHATINRTTLKLGFLGTLIGIILTFPPMKRAVLGLADSDGELKFIRDIALAIDGDQYAILSTLIATGLSILVEFVTIQLLERILQSLETAQSEVNDWNVVCLQPAIARRLDGSQVTVEMERNQNRMETALAEAQRVLEKHLTALTEAMRTAGVQLGMVVDIQAAVGKRIEELAGYERLAVAMAASQRELERGFDSLAGVVRSSSQQVGQVADVQAQLGKRVTELAEYERQYRDFLSAKLRAAAPDGLRGGT